MDDVRHVVQLLVLTVTADSSLWAVHCDHVMVLEQPCRGNSSRTGLQLYTIQ